MKNKILNRLSEILSRFGKGKSFPAKQTFAEKDSDEASCTAAQEAPEDTGMLARDFPEKIPEQLKEVNEYLRMAYGRFEQLVDPDLIESEIYQIKSLQAKQAYLIKLAKTEEAGKTGRVFEDKADRCNKKSVTLKI